MIEDRLGRIESYSTLFGVGKNDDDVYSCDSQAQRALRVERTRTRFRPVGKLSLSSAWYTQYHRV